MAHLVGKGLSIYAGSVLFRLICLMLRPELSLRTRLVTAVAAEIAAILFAVAAPFLLKQAIDLITVRQESRTALFITLLAFALFSSSAGLSAAIRHRIATAITERVTGWLACSVMGSQILVLARDQNRDPAELAGRLERLPSSLQILIEGLVWQAIPVLLQTVLSLTVVLILLPGYYAGIIAIALGLYLLTSWWRTGRFSQDVAIANAAILETSLSVADILRNARRIVLNGNLAGELGEVASHFAMRSDRQERVTHSLILLSALQFGVVATGTAILLLSAAMDMVEGLLSAGDFILVQAYMFRLMLPVGGFAFLLRQSGHAIEQLRDILDLVVVQEAGSLESSARPPGPGTMRLVGVGFRYAAGEGGLAGIDATLQPGSFVVITGPNGAGKSTLARVMAGLLPTTQGVVSLDGCSIAAIPEAQRFQYVLYVPQHISLFNRSLEANGLYPPTHLSAEELTRLLRDWQFYEDGHCPDLARQVGAQGEQLSGGQVQKLELARLMGVKTPVIILDESTSSLDPQSEVRLVHALKRRHSGGSILVLITHRRDLAEMADQILFLQDGCLKADGRHSDLMEMPDYRLFWTG